MAANHRAPTRAELPGQTSAGPARQSWSTFLDSPPSGPTVWARLLAESGQAPERLARAAVRHLGPPAGDWAARTRARYPRATPDGLARLATRQFTRLARRQGAATGVGGAAGAIGSFLGTGLLAHTQARLVLHIAAAYGLDPGSDDRTADVIRLLRLPPAGEPSVPALAAAGRLLGAYAVHRIAARLVPFGAALAGSIHGGRSTDDLAARAVQHYRHIAGAR